MQMSQPGASEWVDLAIHLRWRLPATSAALSAGVIDLGRARIIADGTAVLPDDLASAVEDRVLPKAGEQTTGQLRGAVRRAVIAADPDGAEERRKDTERRAKVSLFPDEHGTATLAGSSLPGVHAAAAMARITAMARALKSSGAKGGLDLLRAHTFLGLLLGTMPLIPPSADGPPGWPQPPDEGPAEPLAEDGAGDPAPDRDDSGSRSAGDGAADDDICPSTDDGAAADHDDSGSRPASGSAAADHDDSGSRPASGSAAADHDDSGSHSASGSAAADHDDSGSRPASGSAAADHDDSGSHSASGSAAADHDDSGSRSAGDGAAADDEDDSSPSTGGSLGSPPADRSGGNTRSADSGPG